MVKPRAVGKTRAISLPLSLSLSLSSSSPIPSYLIVPPPPTFFPSHSNSYILTTFFIAFPYSQSCVSLEMSPFGEVSNEPRCLLIVVAAS